MHSQRASKAGRRLVRFALSYGVAGGCLAWVFHDIHLGAVFRSFSGVNWWLVLPAVAVDLLVYAAAGWEWKILLQPVHRFSLGQTTQAILAGRFANDVLPFHVGYVVRIYLASRWAGAKVAFVAPSLLVERLFDGFWLALGIGWAAIFFPLPERIARVAEIWAGIIVFGLLVGGTMVFGKPKPRERSRRGVFQWAWLRRARRFGAHVVEQVRAIGRSWLVLAAFGVSLLKFILQGLAFLFLLRAYGFHLTVWIQLAVFLIAYVGLSMPSTPASLGVFQVFCVAGLETFHVPRPAATGFAVLSFVALTLPLSVAGFFALAQSGLTLRQVRSESGRWRTQVN